MASKDNHKKRLLQALAVVLSKDDDFRRDDNLEGPDYERWNAARNELVEEFERRGAGAT